MGKRKSTGKRLRFEVLKRDGFRCIYCGASPMDSPLVVKLHADHVEPASLGGESDAANLVTACQDCNLGKSNVPLDNKKLKSEFGSDEEREHAEQIREYLEVQRDIGNAKNEVEQAVLGRWRDRIGEWHWQLPKYIPIAIKDFGLQFVLEAVDIVARKNIRRDIEQVKYFCGILRKKREGTRPDPEQKPAPSADDYRRGALTAFTWYLQYRNYQFGMSFDEFYEVIKNSAMKGVNYHQIFYAIDRSQDAWSNDPARSLSVLLDEAAKVAGEILQHDLSVVSEAERQKEHEARDFACFENTIEGMVGSRRLVGPKTVEWFDAVRREYGHAEAVAFYTGQSATKIVKATSDEEVSSALRETTVSEMVSRCGTDGLPRWILDWPETIALRAAA